MNVAEQRARIKDIMTTIKDAQIELKSKFVVVEGILKLSEELSAKLDGIVSEEIFDADEFTSNLIDNILTEVFENASDELSEFQRDINELISEVSERRAETLEEKYYNLDEVVNKFDQSVQGYTTPDEVDEHINEALQFLKEML